MYTINCFEQNKQIEKFYDLYHKLYLDIWGNYDNLALHMGYYDTSIKSHEESLLRLNEIIFDMAKIRQNDLVLDAGCGVGGSSIWLAKLKGCKVIGISLAKKEIKLARKFAKQNKVDNIIRFEAMNMIKTNFSDNFFNVIIAIESTCYIINKLFFLKEASRILKQGERLIISDYFFNKSYSLTEKYYMNCINKESSINLCSFEEFENLMKLSGFGDIKQYNISSNIKESYEKGIIKLSKLIETVTDPLLKKEILEEKKRNSLELFCLNRKILHYGIVSAIKI
ncbi:MAG TPA: methyltransferase domain-containing protein [Nitrososphaeraceae archaeon]|nr:methyltransferase domain-containing protein [Nitrososphaeraceae archaeon]